MIFPYGTKTIETTADRDIEFVWINTTTPKTLLNARIQQSGVASTTEILCGDVPVIRNYAKDFPQYLMMRACNDVIKIKKVGQDEAFISLTYFDGDLTQENQNPPPQAPLNYFYINNPAEAQGNFSIFKNYSYGEITITIFLSLIFFVLLFNTLKNLFIPPYLKIVKRIKKD